MKFLVIGCNGMVGHVVALYLKEQGHDVHGLDESPSELVDSKIVSFYDRDSIAGCINQGSYDAVINCTAIINQDAEADKAGASYINTYLPHYLEQLTAGTKTVVVHRSTDCIFSGKRGQYTLEDVPDAASFYARSKALGELNNEKDITIRTSLIGPEYDINGSGLFNWFYNQSGSVNGFANAIWTGLTTIEFAREIEWLLLHKAHGLYQLVPGNAISKYELLLMFEKAFPGNREVVRVDNARVDKSLLPVSRGYDIPIPSYEDMVSEMKKWIDNHSALYTNYIDE